jgi:hypothetical protein
VQGHREDAVGAGGGEQVGDQAAADGDPRGVLLVAAGVRVMRQHHGDPPGRGALRGVQHEQQLDQVFLGGWDEWLDQEHVPLPAVALELHLDAVVGEPGHPGGQQRHTQVLADLGGQAGMGTSGEDGDVAHRPTLRCARRPRSGD